MKQKLLFVAITISLFACSSKEEVREEKVFKEIFKSNVKTVRAELVSQNEELVLTGKVEYNPDNVMNYTSLVNGVVNQTYFSLGDKVQKGQPLLEIRSSEVSSLQSDLLSLKDEIEIAERELISAETMYEDNMLSEKELLEIKAKLRQAKSSHARTNSDISVLGRSKGSGVLSIQSPMNGYIVSKNTSSGSTISSEGDVLFTVADLSKVWIIANVYANNLNSIKEDMEVGISLLSYPNEMFSGKISHLSQVFDSDEKVLKARIEMDNKDLKFKPEMSAIVRLKDATLQQYISVPSDALIFDSDRYYVITEDEEYEYKIKEVQLQGHHKKTTYIASGLLEGEIVVVKNQLLIYSELKESFI